MSSTTSRRIIAAILTILGLLVLLGIGYYLFAKYIGTVNIPSKDSDTVGSTDTNTDGVTSLTGFDLPAGFVLNIFAKDVPGARDIEIDPVGRVVVSQTSQGKILALDGDESDSERTTLATGLTKPHGLAFKCEGIKCFLYVAEQGGLSRYPYDSTGPSLGAKEFLIPFNSSSLDRHFTRSLLFLPSPNENTLLISIGSSCDVCHEKETDYGTIISYNVATKKTGVYAKGLRNAVFMTLNPVNGKVFATEMGRDNLGDNLPPDEINIISPSTSSGQSSIPNFGWPVCFGKNIHDDQFDKNTYIRNPCMEPFETPSFVDLQAHSAPLGLDFIPEEGWPENYWYNLLVAYHGSWNRSVPTGYKIVRVKMNAKGEYLGTEDFITGWLKGAKDDETKAGRPVDIKVLSGGVAYISDDSAGVIYRLHRK